MLTVEQIIGWRYLSFNVTIATTSVLFRDKVGAICAMPVKTLKPAKWAKYVEDILNSAGNPLFKSCELKWSKPTIWKKDMARPAFDTSAPFVYALIRNHGKSKTKDHIEYIGLTTAPRSRFGNHETALDIVKQRGTVGFSYAPVDFIRGRNRIERIETALEEIEHLLIWAVHEDLWNEKKQMTLPGLGANGGNAWDIQNTGYRFSGRMPRRIVYPWMVVQPGRNRTER